MRVVPVAAAMIGATLSAAPAAAQFGLDAPAEARLLAGWEAAPGTRIAALEIALDPGWKTYWRAPGEAGIPPLFDWSASRNLADIEIEWPAPELFDSFGLATLGYGGRVVLPLVARAEDPTDPIRLALTLDYGVCAEICVPARADLVLDIPPGAPEEARGAIEAARERRPLSAEEAGVASASCDLRGAGAERAVSAEIAFAAPPVEAPFVVVEGPEPVWIGAASAALTGSVLRAEAPAVLPDPQGWIARDALTLTLIGRGWAAEIPGCDAG